MPFSLKNGFPSILQALLSMLFVCGESIRGAVFTWHSGWAVFSVSCIISSRTFVTDTTCTGRLQFVFSLGCFFSFFFFCLFFLNKYVSGFSYYFFFEYIAHFIIRKEFCFRQKVFLHPGGTNVYYFLKEVSGCLCGHLQRGQNGRACRIQV